MGTENVVKLMSAWITIVIMAIVILMVETQHANATQDGKEKTVHNRVMTKHLLIIQLKPQQKKLSQQLQKKENQLQPRQISQQLPKKTNQLQQRQISQQLLKKINQLRPKRSSQPLRKKAQQQHPKEPFSHSQQQLKTNSM